MHTHSPGPLEIQSDVAEFFSRKDGDFSAPSSSLTMVDKQMPAKKQTRQWAAWTRQEEENFFIALRQVGKNFEKITCRVQSKNKDQVRHYYYRLVRRMNKLLSPGFSLDAKNSKDTNAAMLRWWSLLEKYSCTASKLHLKPRRFKIFIEALENQLLKDRNKNKRKRPCQREIYLAAPSTSIPSKALGNDDRPVKVLVVGTQNNRKFGATKGASLKRNMSTNINFSKAELPAMRTVRERRKPAVASAAYKRWEKAAKAGVSLVADAAEQLERTTNDLNCSFDQGSFIMLSNGMYAVGDQIKERVLQPPTKLKLQLFPIDEATRQALEKDACNPHLELTLSARKRISSVLEHLNRKWGNSSIASGELILFPYSARHENLASLERWTVKDIISSAADVYATVGCPENFRLRYGWFPSSEPMKGIDQMPSPAVNLDTNLNSEDIQEGFNMDVLNRETFNTDFLKPATSINHISEQPVEQSLEDQSSSMVASVPSGNTSEPTLVGDYSAESRDESPQSFCPVPSFVPEESTKGGCCRKQPEDMVNLSMRNCGTLSAVEWADSLTNISIGDLLSEESNAADSCGISSSLCKCAPLPQERSYSCDSFDAAVAAHISGLRTQTSSTSMWNAEETCDEFSFHMVPTCKMGEASDPSLFSNPVGDFKQHAQLNSVSFQGCLKDLTKSGSSSVPYRVDLEYETENPSSNKEKQDATEDLNLTDNIWPDSLGPLDLDIPSVRYPSQDIAAFGDSLSFSGLSRMIENCSILGMDKKDLSRSGEA